MNEVGRDEVQRLLAESGTQLVDVLPAAEFAEEHLPEAVNIPLAERAEPNRTHNAERHRPFERGDQCGVAVRGVQPGELGALAAEADVPGRGGFGRR